MVSISTHLKLIEFNVIDIATPDCLDRHFRFNHLWKTLIYFISITASYHHRPCLGVCCLSPTRFCAASRSGQKVLPNGSSASTPVILLSPNIIATVPYRKFSCIYLNCKAPSQSTCGFSKLTCLFRVTVSPALCGVPVRCCYLYPFAYR